MRVKLSLFCCILFLSSAMYGQKKEQTAIADTTFMDYDELFSDLDDLIDSLYAPRNFTVASLSIGNGFFNYRSATAASAAARQRIILSPSLGFFHKTGLGISAGASVINDSSHINPFQFSLTGSYDYMRNKKFITGMSLSHFFTKNDLNFYTSPLQNELYGYFTYRNHWLKPSIASSYGWGSRGSVQQQMELIKGIQNPKTTNGNNGNGNGNGNSGGNGNGNGNNGNGNGNGGGNSGGNGNGGGTTTGSDTLVTVSSMYEKIVDFSVSVSVRRDFYLLKLLSKKDYLRLTPQLSFTSGTQQFGFNSVNNTYRTIKGVNSNVITNTQNVMLDDKLKFQPLSVTAQLRTEYSIGKFYIQPQMFLDYYIPATEKNFTTAFMVNTGFIF